MNSQQSTANSQQSTANSSLACSKRLATAVPNSKAWQEHDDSTAMASIPPTAPIAERNQDDGPSNSTIDLYDFTEKKMGDREQSISNVELNAVTLKSYYTRNNKTNSKLQNNFLKPSRATAVRHGKPCRAKKSCLT